MSNELRPKMELSEKGINLILTKQDVTKLKVENEVKHIEG